MKSEASGVGTHDVGGRAGYGPPNLDDYKATPETLSGSAFAARWAVSYTHLTLPTKA